MMLRSSSTPVLGSLLSSYAESPNHNLSEINALKNSPFSFHPNQSKLPSGCLHLTSSWSCHCYNSTVSPSVAESYSSANGIRRAQSDGNLEALASASCENLDEFDDPIPFKKFSRKPSLAVLETIPSFSGHKSSSMFGEQEEGSDYDEEEEEAMFACDNEIAMGIENTTFSAEKSMVYVNQLGNLGMIEETENSVSKMHLAVGLGVGMGGFGGGGSGNKDGCKQTGSGGDGGERASPEEYYKRMVEQDPLNPLFLRNYAQYLHHSKKDLQGAEEYYSRAILADPNDGEIMSHYAKLIWERYEDHERASSYFERATQAAPEDSHVHAAYANFLWETEEEEEEEDEAPDLFASMHPLRHNGTLATAKA